MSVKIMNAFVEMRHFIADNDHMFEQIRSIDYKLGSPKRSTGERFELLISLVHRTEREIVLIDGYIDTETLNILAKKKPGGAVHNRFLSMVM